MGSIKRLIFLTFVCFGTIGSIYAQNDTISTLRDMSLEEMLGLKITTASKKPQKIENIPASVTIITRKDIEKYGYLSLKEIIANIPGFYITDENTFFDTAINVRGFWSRVASHVMILVNGVPQLVEFDKSFTLNTINIPVESIDKIEIVRGAKSVVYGSGAFFGVINIITNEAGDTGQNNIASVSYGTRNQKRVQFLTEMEEDDLKISINGFIGSREGEDWKYSDLMTDEKLNEPGNAYIDKISMGTAPYSRSSKSFNLSADYLGIYGLFSHVSSDIGFANAFAPMPNQKASQKINNTRITLGYKKDFSEKIKLNLMGSYHNYSFWADNLVAANRFDTIQNTFSFFSPEMESYTVMTDLFFNPYPGLNVTMGFYTIGMPLIIARADLSVINLQNTQYYLKEGETIYTHAAYTQFDYRLSDKFLVEGGLRLEREGEYVIFRHNRNGLTGVERFEEGVPASKLHVIPEASLIYSPNNDNYVKLIYGKAIRQASIHENSFILNFNIQNDANLPFLESEEVQTLELNFIGSLTPNLLINTSYFHNELSNLVVTDLGIVNNLQTTFSSNSGKKVTNGFELSVTGDPTTNFNIGASVTYQKTKDKAHMEIEPEFSPNLLGYLKLAYSKNNLFGKVGHNHLILGLNATYVDNMKAFYDFSPAEESPTEDPNNPSFIAKGRIGEDVSSYILVNPSIRIGNFLIEGLYFNTKIMNVLNTQYHYPTYAQASWADRGMLGESRALVVTVGYKF